jgi:lipopolysaccharide biosynthesis glycosyltransferase
MENADVFHFVQHARPWNRIKDRTFPREAAEDEFQAAELQKPRGREGADNVTSAANSDHQRA